jgi:hypothetical protein
MNYRAGVVVMRAAIIDAVSIAYGCSTHGPNQRENNVGLGLRARAAKCAIRMLLGEKEVSSNVSLQIFFPKGGRKARWL